MLPTSYNTTLRPSCSSEFTTTALKIIQFLPRVPCHISIVFTTFESYMHAHPNLLNQQDSVLDALLPIYNELYQQQFLVIVKGVIDQMERSLTRYKQTGNLGFLHKYVDLVVKETLQVPMSKWPVYSNEKPSLGGLMACLATLIEAIIQLMTVSFGMDNSQQLKKLFTKTVEKHVSESDSYIDLLRDEFLEVEEKLGADQMEGSFINLEPIGKDQPSHFEEPEVEAVWKTADGEYLNLAHQLARQNFCLPEDINEYVCLPEKHIRMIKKMINSEGEGIEKNIDPRIESFFYVCLNLKKGNPKGDIGEQFVRLVRYIYTYFKQSLKKSYPGGVRRSLLAFLKRLSLKLRSETTVQIYLPFILKVYEEADLNNSEYLTALNEQQILAGPSMKFPKANQKEAFMPQQFGNQRLAVQIQKIKQKLSLPLPQLTLLKLTPMINQKVVTFLFSGFMSEASDHLQDWGGTIQVCKDSELYTIDWESTTEKNMFKFVLKSVGQILLKGKLGSIAAIFSPAAFALKFATILKDVYRIYKENPFTLAKANAQIAGIYIAELLMANFSGRLVNLVGFSLGTELIACLLRHLKGRKATDMINKVTLIGGAACSSSFDSIVSDFPETEWINFYNPRDKILKYLLKVFVHSIHPVGLQQLNAMRNVDVSGIVKGHTGYRQKMTFFGKQLHLDQFTEIQ